MYRLCPNMVQITVLFLSRSVVTPRHQCIIMNKVVNESLREICHYKQNVPQHYYLLDTIVTKYSRLSHDVVTCDIDRDVSAGVKF